jgi:ATP-dependent 26S proteasome regulatory subunit
LIVAEDSDEFLRLSARREAGAALGRLLNLTDGILGQGSNTLILLTTNELLENLHPALIRPGRCLAQIEFEDICSG